MAEKYELPKGATAADFATRRWGGPTRLEERQVTIGTTVGDLLANNPRRVFWIAQNRGAADISTSNQRDVTSTTGFLLAATGGVQSMDAEEDGEAVTYARFAISGTAGQVVAIIEVMRV